MAPAASRTSSPATTGGACSRRGSATPTTTAATAAIATCEAFNKLTATTGNAFNEMVNATNAVKLKNPAANMTHHWSSGTSLIAAGPNRIRTNGVRVTTPTDPLTNIVAGADSPPFNVCRVITPNNE